MTPTTSRARVARPRAPKDPRARRLELVRAKGYASISELTRALNTYRVGKRHVSRQVVSRVLAVPAKSGPLRRDLAGLLGVDEATLFPEVAA